MRSNQTSYKFACASSSSKEYLELFLVDNNTNSEDETSTNVVDDEEGLLKNEWEDEVE